MSPTCPNSLGFEHRKVSHPLSFNRLRFANLPVDRVPILNAETTVTHWIQQLKAGQSAAAQKLWESYFAQMVRLARNRLKDAPRRASDEEDVALSAFKSFCLGVQAGRFPQLSDRDSLWPLLVAITSHKAIDTQRHESRKKRGGGHAVGSGSSAIELDQLLSSEPTPELAAQMVEEFERLLAVLPDEALRQIALLRLDGHSVEEIAQKLDCVARTVERKLHRIRTLWSEAGGEFE